MALNDDDPLDQHEYETRLADRLARRDAKIRKIEERRRRRNRRRMHPVRLIPRFITGLVWAALWAVLGMFIYRDMLIRMCDRPPVLHDPKSQRAATIICVPYTTPSWTSPQKK